MEQPGGPQLTATRVVDAWESSIDIATYLCDIYRDPITREAPHICSIDPLNNRTPVEFVAKRVIIEKELIFRGSLLNFESQKGPIAIFLNENEKNDSDDLFYPKDSKTGKVLKEYNIDKAYLVSFAIIECVNPFNINIGLKINTIADYKSNDNESINHLLKQGYIYGVKAKETGIDKVLYKTEDNDVPEKLIQTFGGTTYNDLIRGIILLPDIPPEPPKLLNYTLPTNNKDDREEGKNKLKSAMSITPIYKKWVITSPKHAIVQAAVLKSPPENPKIKLQMFDDIQWLLIDRKLTENLITSMRDTIYPKLRTFNPRQMKIEICNFFSTDSWGTCITQQQQQPNHKNNNNDIIKEQMIKDITTVQEFKVKIRMVYIVFPKDMSKTVCTVLSFTI